MKKLLVLVVTLIYLGPGLAFAHCGTCAASEKIEAKRQKYHEKKMKKITKMLGLSEEQVEKFKAAMKNKHDQKKVIKDEMRQKMEVVYTAFKAEISGFLSPPQVKKLDKHWAKEKGKRKHKGHY